MGTRLYVQFEKDTHTPEEQDRILEQLASVPEGTSARLAEIFEEQECPYEHGDTDVQMLHQFKIYGFGRVTWCFQRAVLEQLEEADPEVGSLPAGHPSIPALMQAQGLHMYPIRIVFNEGLSLHWS